MNFEPDKLFWILKRYDFEAEKYFFSRVIMSEAELASCASIYSNQRIEVIPCRQDDIPYLLNYIFMGCEKLSCNSNEFLGKLDKLLSRAPAQAVAQVQLSKRETEE